MTDSAAGYEWGRLSVGHGSCSCGGSVHRVGVCGGGVVVHSLRRPRLANAVAGAPSEHALWLAGKRAGLAPGRHCSVQWKLRCSEEGKALQRGPCCNSLFCNGEFVLILMCGSCLQVVGKPGPTVQRIAGHDLMSNTDVNFASALVTALAAAAASRYIF